MYYGMPGLCISRRPEREREYNETRYRPSIPGVCTSRNRTGMYIPPSCKRPVSTKLTHLK